MKITVLDGYAANPNEFSWDEFKKVADIQVYERTPENLVVQRIGDSDGIFLNKVNITKEILDKCPNLKYIGVLATGFNVVDIKAASEKGIVVTNIPSYSTNAVAQHVFAFILNYTNQVQLHSESVHKNDWCKSQDFCYWISPLQELSGKTLGIFGYGAIGKQVAKIAHSFDMNVIVCPHNLNTYKGNEKAVSKEELFSESDFITLHSPLTPETKNLVDSKTLKLVKKSCMIINTARGGVVNESEIATALKNKTFACYAADVIQNEPMEENCPLLNCPNCILTPHIAWAPKETRTRLFKISLENLKAFLNGNPINKVN